MTVEGSSTYNVIPTRHPHPPVAGDRNRWGMRQDELDLIQALPPAPVLHGAGPTMPGVAKAMDEDNGGRVLRCGREDQRGGSSDA